jgi:hypothetical protein
VAKKRKDKFFVMECNVRGKIEALLAEQISRLTSSGIKTREDIMHALKRLNDDQLMPNQIERDLCKEIKSSCKQKWSVVHTQDHVARLLKSKLSELFTILRNTESNKNDV